MQNKSFAGLLLILWLPVSQANTTQTLSTFNPVANGLLALLLVLALFGACVLLLKKVNATVITGGGKIRVTGGLALGMREKVVLLQVGRKQVLLAVTPGRIQTLLVLEGEDCLNNDDNVHVNEGFAHKLMQAIKVQHDVSAE